MKKILAVAVLALVPLAASATAVAKPRVNVPPTASFKVVGGSKNTIIVDTSASVDPDGQIVGQCPHASKCLSGFSWDASPDGEVNEFNGHPNQWKVSYASPGTKTLKLKVCDTGSVTLNCSDWFSLQVTVGGTTGGGGGGGGGGGPRANAFLVSSRWSGDAGDPETVVLDGSGSGAGITSYHWSFDDGQSADGAKVEHGFATGGEHTATLTVTDGSNNTSSTTVKIKKIAASVGTSLKVKNTTAKLSVKMPKKSYFGVQNLMVDWGDGSPSQPITGKTVSHTYTAPGTYPVAVSYSLVAPLGCTSFCGPYTQTAHETAVVH